VKFARNENPPPFDAFRASRGFVEIAQSRLQLADMSSDLGAFARDRSLNRRATRRRNANRLRHETEKETGIRSLSFHRSHEPNNQH
jgi:hypothetical protein